MNYCNDPLAPWLFRLRQDFAEELCFLDDARDLPSPHQEADLMAWRQDFGFLPRGTTMNVVELSGWLQSPARLHSRMVLCENRAADQSRWVNIFNGGGLLASYEYSGLVEYAYLSAFAALRRRGQARIDPRDALLVGSDTEIPRDVSIAAPYCIAFDSRLGLATVLPLEDVAVLRRFFRTEEVPTPTELRMPRDG